MGGLNVVFIVSLSTVHCPVSRGSSQQLSNVGFILLELWEILTAPELESRVGESVSSKLVVLVNSLQMSSLPWALEGPDRSRAWKQSWRVCVQ